MDAQADALDLKSFFTSAAHTVRWCSKRGRACGQTLRPISLPAWSPDGQFLAFSSENSLAWQLSPDVESPNSLPEDQLYPSEFVVERDGIVYERRDPGVFVARRDGPGLRRVSDQPADYVFWALDGSELILISDLDVWDPQQGRTTYTLDSIRFVPLDGGHEREVVFNDWAGAPAVAALSPDGTRFAVLVNWFPRNEHNIVLYTMATDGSDVQILVKIDENWNFVPANLGGSQS